MAKPFSIQSPEDIAKEYGGNKQRIAQAMQLGVVDPTAGVLAGMFIDRMRSAQMQEQAPQATVAQQVMGGAPTAPAPAPSGGLGTAPQAMPQPAPPMAPAQPPMGMADGGLATLPVPDAMFDEPTNGGFDDGYAGGGLVAFADGGAAGGWGDYIEEMVRKLDPNIQVSGRARTPARNAEVRGVPNSYHLIDAARDIRTPEGMDKSEFIAQLKGVFGSDYDILPSAGRSVHIEPGPKLGEKVRAGATPTLAMPERDLETAGGRAMSAQDAMTLGRGLLAGLPRQELERARAYALEELDPAKQEKERKTDMWQALAEMGFRMAASDSPYVLQAIGQAATATLPGMQASKKERKAAKNEAIRTLMTVEDVDRKTATAGVELGMDIYKTGLSQEQFKQQQQLRERGLILDERQVKLAEDKLAAEIEAAKRAGADPEKVAASYVLNYKEGTPQYEAAKRYYNLRFGAREGRSSNADETAARVRAGGGGQTPAPPADYVLD